MAKNMIVLKDSVFTEILTFLDEVERHGTKIEANVVNPGMNQVVNKNTVA